MAEARAAAAQTQEKAGQVAVRARANLGRQQRGRGQSRAADRADTNAVGAVTARTLGHGSAPVPPKIIPYAVRISQRPQEQVRRIEPELGLIWATKRKWAVI